MTQKETTPSSPLYADVTNKLIEAITSGQYTVGSLLPTEFELAAQYNVSRQTVRAALKVLQDLGYISRKKGVGSCVESLDPSAGYTQSLAALEDLVLIAASEARQIHSVETVTLNRALARQLNAPLGSEWVRFTGARVDLEKENRPMSWANIYVDARFKAISDEVIANPTVLISTILEPVSGQPIQEVRQIVSATLIDEELSAHLGVPVGSPALRILRHYKTARNSILEITESIYPAERMSLSTVLRRTDFKGRMEKS